MNQSNQKLTGKRFYNIVADTITGVNFRKKDNLFQFIAIVVSMVLSVIGTQLFYKINNGLLWFESSVELFVPSLIFGLFAGLIISGAAIAIYRSIRHMTNNND